MIDTKSETWETVEAWMSQELAATSRKLGNKHSDYHDTMFNRGYQAALEALQALPKKEAVKPVEIDTYFT
jgi:hypothetical protein